MTTNSKCLNCTVEALRDVISARTVRCKAKLSNFDYGWLYTPWRLADCQDLTTDQGHDREKTNSLSNTTPPATNQITAPQRLQAKLIVTSWPQMNAVAKASCFRSRYEVLPLVRLLLHTERVIPKQIPTNASSDASSNEDALVCSNIHCLECGYRASNMARKYDHTMLPHTHHFWLNVELHDKPTFWPLSIDNIIILNAWLLQFLYV